MVKNRTSLALAALALAAVAPSCVIYDSYATASFTWDFAGRSCEEAGVHTVRVEIEGYDADVFEAVSVDCFEGGITFEELPIGLYFVHLDGIGGPFTWHSAGDIDVHGGANDFVVHLEAIEAH